MSANASKMARAKFLCSIPRLGCGQFPATNLLLEPEVESVDWIKFSGPSSLAFVPVVENLIAGICTNSSGRFSCIDVEKLYGFIPSVAPAQSQWNVHFWLLPVSGSHLCFLSWLCVSSRSIGRWNRFGVSSVLNPWRDSPWFSHG